MGNLESPINLNPPTASGRKREMDTHAELAMQIGEEYIYNKKVVRSEQIMHDYILGTLLARNN